MATITDEEKKSIAEDVKKQLIASAKSVQDFEKITELPESGSVTLPVVQPDGSTKVFDAGNWLKDRETAYKATQSATADAKTATSAANTAAESANDAATEANSAADAANKRTEELNDTNVGKFDSRMSAVETDLKGTKQTVDDYFNKLIDVPCVFMPQDVVARYDDKIWDGEKWTQITPRNSSTWILDIEKAVSVQIAYWSSTGGVYVCKDIDEDGNLIGSTFWGQYANTKKKDSTGYRYLIINAGNGVTKKPLYGSSGYVFYYIKMTQAEYDKQIVSDNAFVQPLCTKFMFDGIQFCCNPLADGAMVDDSIKYKYNGVIGTNARNVTCSGNTLNIQGNPRLESVYLVNASGVLTIVNNIMLKELRIDNTSECTSFSLQQNTSIESIFVRDWDLRKCSRIYFQNCTSLKNLDGINNWDTSNITNMSYMFSETAVSELNVPNWDFSKVTTMQYFFSDRITTFIFSEIDFANIYYTPDTWNVSSFKTIKGTMHNLKYSIKMPYSPLTRDSALVLLNGLADLTGQTSQTITFSSTTKALLTDDDIAIATKKNWNLA